MNCRAFSFGLGVAFSMSLSLVAPPASAQYFNTPTVLPGGAIWTNYLRLDDLDGDGDLDLTIPNCGGFFSNPNPQELFVLANDGSASFMDAGMALGMSGTLPVRVAAVADIDADGDLDVFLPSAGGTARTRWSRNRRCPRASRS